MGVHRRRALSNHRSWTPVSGYVYYLISQAGQRGGIENYADYWVLSRIVRRYSDFVSYPIMCKTQREEVDRDKSGRQRKDGTTTIVVEDKILNSMKPIWTRHQSEVAQEEYVDFYRHTFYDWNKPFRVLALRAEGTVEYQALLFIPSRASYDLFYHATEGGLRLYANCVLIMERCEDLLPRYLRFIKGVVDSTDLPLNISRQMPQQDRHIAQIKRWATKKILSTVHDSMQQEADKYLMFWEQFGRALKEGVSSDYDNRDLLVSLLLFQSSQDGEQLTTLRDYVSRMKPEQKEIYYLTGETRDMVMNSPHLEAFRERGYEVLCLIDPVDELLVQALPEFEGKRLRSVGKGAIALGNDEEKKKVEESLKEIEQEAAGLLNYIQQHLQHQVKEVRLSNRLVSSPVCLVGTEIDYSPQMERLLQKGRGNGSKQRRIMELNPSYEVFVKMLGRYK